MNSLYKIRYWNERTGREGTLGTLVSLAYGRDYVARMSRQNPNIRYWLVKVSSGTPTTTKKKGTIR